MDYTRVSDDDYFRDLGNTTLEVSSQTNLSQLGDLSYNTDNWLFRVMGREYQTIVEDIDDQYKLLPRIEANGDYRLGDFEFEINNQFSSFDHSNDGDLTPDSDPTKDDTFTFITDEKGTYITGDRLRLNYAATWDKQWAWGYFRPTAKVKHITYDLDDPLLGQNDDSPSVTVPVGIIDTGLYFERDTTLLSGYTQTFEPRLYMVYSKYEDQSDLPDFDTSLLTFSYSQLFRDDRFVGGDRIGDAEQISVGFTTRLIDQSTGIERLRASLGQIFYLDDRYVSLNTALTKSVLNSLGNPNDLTNLEQREIADGLLRDES
ncbi:MAG: LPS-assembly protein LptD, partial [Porticoccus sp.]|nr:LPS-assembly protein LptD [Porticoccus sp.]